MTLPMPGLDDRTFQDLVDEAKRRIPHHAPEWTDHNLSDPGVALIELFAWMTESIIYQLNVVPDRLYRHFLELVGITPYPPQPASADVTFWVSPTETETRTVPVGARVATTQDPEHGAVEYQTTEEVVIRQPRLISAVRAGPGEDKKPRGRFDGVKSLLDLGDQRVPCFDPLRAGSALYFGFGESLAANVLHVAVETSIHGTGIEPDHPPLVWEASTGQGCWKRAEVDHDGDSTAGLNVSGRVLLHLPKSHTRQRYGTYTAYWIRVMLTGDHPSYAEPPVLDRVSFTSLGGRARVEQGESVGREELGISDGTADQSFHTIERPVLARRGDEFVEVARTNGMTQRWTEVSNFAASGPEDRHYTWDSASGEIRFGPAVRERVGTVRRHGAIPETGATVAVTGYRTGGGQIGNAAPDRIVVLRSGLPFIQRIGNRRGATGGVDAETIDNVKVRGPQSLITGDRAVTAQDFEQLAWTYHPQIARVRCRDDGTVRVRTDPEAGGDQKPLSLFVVPRAPQASGDRPTIEDFAPAPELLHAVAKTLDERRLVGVRIDVGPPNYRLVSVAAHVTADLHHQTMAVRDRCIDALHAYINPLTGGPEEDGWPWGRTIERGAISQLLKGLDGVHEVQEVLFFDVDAEGRESDRTPVRYGVGVDRFPLPDLALPVSALHQVVVDEFHRDDDVDEDEDEDENENENGDGGGGGAS